MCSAGCGSPARRPRRAGEAGRSVRRAILGAGIRSSSAAHTDEHSARARCQPTTCSPATATNTTAFRRSHMSSRSTTSCTSPVKGAIGHIPQAQEALRQNVERLTPRSTTASLESSHRRNSSNRLAALPCLRTLDALHFRQLHRLAPAFVLPLPFILAPHVPHSGLFKPDSLLLAISLSGNPSLPRRFKIKKKKRGGRTRF